VSSANLFKLPALLLGYFNLIYAFAVKLIFTRQNNPKFMRSRLFLLLASCRSSPWSVQNSTQIGDDGLLHPGLGAPDEVNIFCYVKLTMAGGTAHIYTRTGTIETRFSLAHC